MTRFEDAVSRDLAAAPSPPPVEHFRHRARRRRLRVWTIGLVAFAAIGALSLVVLRSTRHEPTVSVSPTVHTTDKPTAVPTTTRQTGLTFPRSTAPTVNRSAPEPTHFFASIGAGGERVALVDTATGKHGPFLTSASQALVRFSSDLTTIYDPVANAGCGHTWTAINVGTGTSKPAFQDLNHPADVVESPDRKKVAYLQSTGTDGCRQSRLVVRDTTTGRERHWIQPANPNGRGETITQLEWSPDSSHLSYELNAGRTTTAWVLDINRGTTLTDGVQLRSPDAACTLWVPRFQPGTNLIVTAENCIGRSAQLVSYNATTGAIEKTTPVANGAIFGIIDLAIDPSGQHLLYILSYEANQPSEVYTLRNGTPVRLLNDAYQVAW